jgi:hypothetical protein
MLLLTDNDVVGVVRAFRRILLITGNRSSGADSLEQTIHEQGRSDSFPVRTIGDPQRVMRDPAYARECAMSLLDFVERIETLRRTGRLFIP